MKLDIDFPRGLAIPDRNGQGRAQCPTPTERSATFAHGR
jgi:hypothetical protein